ncbi:COG1361 S-layer family protein [Fusibacter sp. A1]|uniref:COG1361 S-layer family protein n=2 Tax=unclassified Fusibacter TaxID=2624464 RepID=UPI0010116C6B|nr:hypothetical protein [Fusibacter sp. A1]MCK8059515.1 hypothetical protein [Fusibacter sp. A2]NPE21021.1 hypothetical protein [Fusibacter sp. A1]RXV62295.1 hypothetical protein DWB64_04240 [Fusibacter sp. A1]
MKYIRNSFGIVLVLLLLFTLTHGATNYTITGSRVTHPDSSIREGESFTLSMTFNELNPFGDLTLVNTSTSSFVLDNRATAVSVSDINNGTTISIALEYLGSGNTFSFNLIEDATGNTVYSDSIFISETKETDNTPSVPTDTSKYQPNITLENGTVLGSFETGKLHTIAVKVKNDSTHSAKNITATIGKGSDALPIVMEGATIKDTLSMLAMNKSDTLDFKFHINPAAAPKTYDLVLNITYENAYGDDFVVAVPVYISVVNNELEPIVGVTSAELDGGFVGSETAKKLTLTVKNGGTLKAQKIIVQLTGMDAEGIRLSNDLDTKAVGNLAQNMTGSATFNVIASPTAVGVQSLSAKITYFDEMGGSYERTAPVYIETASGKASTKNIEMSFDNQRYTFTGSESKLISVTLKNNAQQVKKDLKLSLSSDASLRFLSPYVQMVDSLNPGEAVTLEFETMLGTGVQANTYPLYAALTSAGGSEGDQRIQVAGVQVLGEQTGSKPKIIIDSYDYGSDSILAGQTYDLTIRFKNTSTSMGIRNAKVTFAAEDGVFIPVDAANSFFIERIGAGEVVEKTLTLKTKADANVKMYGVDFKVEYEDQNGNSYDEKDNPYVAEERISVNVKQEVRLEVADIFLPFETFVGMPIQVDAEFYNMGKSTMYNMMVKLEGNFQAQDSNYFVGNFEPGRSDYFSGTMFPADAGNLEGRLVFVFEDETGVKQEIEKTIQLVVMEQQGFEGGEGEYPGGEFGDGGFDGGLNGGFGDGGDEVKEPFTLPIWAMVIIAVVVIALIAFGLRLRKKKRLASLLEDEDENE